MTVMFKSETSSLEDGIYEWLCGHMKIEFEFSRVKRGGEADTEVNANGPLLVAEDIVQEIGLTRSWLFAVQNSVNV